jgi:4Fe-4S binding domain
MIKMIRQIATLIGSAGLIFLCVLSESNAGMMPKDELEKLFEDQYIVGELQTDLPVYPLFIKEGASPESKPELRGYVFETNEVVSVRGYSGKPINILVVIDLSGRLLSAKLIDHKEPIFLDSYGISKLTEFAAQYKGLSVRHSIEINKATDTPSRNEHSAYLRGVHRGTISAKAINRTIMTAAAKVALAKLKINVTDNLDEKRTENESSPQHSNADIKPAAPTSTPTSTPTTAPTPTANATPTADTKSADTPKPPVATAEGKATVSEVTTKQPPLREVLEKTSGENAPKDPEKLADSRIGQKTEASDSSIENQPVNGLGSVSQDFSGKAEQLNYLSVDLATRREWIKLWQSRGLDIAILLSGLFILSLGLIAQKRFSANSQRLRILRTVYLLFTLGFIGWYAQGQLTIVNITAALESLTTGGDLSFLMNDPMTVILWLFVGLTLLVWGRGTFCGWLCPFGALQELISLVANAIGIRQRRLRAALDAKLKWVKYLVLATLLTSLYVAPRFAEKAVEIEPFKTAISFYFQRDWPYVLWAVACLLLGVVVYRGYCRYICPLGAALASVNFLQRWSWIARRDACGTPCQSCRHRCEYQAIAPTGKINYSECFQCLDCVSIYQDDQRCLPLIQQRKASNRVIPVHVTGFTG